MPEATQKILIPGGSKFSQLSKIAYISFQGKTTLARSDAIDHYRIGKVEMSIPPPLKDKYSFRLLKLNK